MALIASAIVSARAQELPADATIEPPILPGNLEPQREPQQPEEIAALARNLTRARESAAGAERLVRIGALAKVEAENRALRVIRLESQVADAQLSAAQTDLERKETKLAAGEIAPVELEQVRQQLVDAKTKAESAAATLKRAELEAAAVNLERQRKLLVLGSGRKSTLRKAEETLAGLRAQSTQ